ncbi:MAG: DUF3769 domain-containing protein, partial [Oscillatoriaceae cyanobacterium Prado104]|nr:DUF3769 domain-containing protein [Oscillatoriaceae cyanobacterium Prado104]
MSYPVPPPEPSAIIYIAKPKKVTLAVAAASQHSSKPAALPEASPGTTEAATASEDSSNFATIPEASPGTIEPTTANENSSRNNSAVIPKPSPNTIEPESTAELLGPPVETGQTSEIADPLAAVASGSAKLSFQNPTAAREPVQRETQTEAGFTTYRLPPAGSRNAQPITATPSDSTGEKIAPQQENKNLAQNRQPENKSPEPVEIPVPEGTPEPAPSGQQQLEIPTPATPPTPQSQPKPSPVPGQRTPPGQRTVPLPVTPGDTIEIKADSQEFDEKQQIVTAVGNVVVRFRQAVIDADRAIVNLITRQVVASGNVAYTRGQQVVRGQRMEFNLGLNAGTVEQASGELFLPAAGSDLTPTLPTDISAGTILEQPLSDRITSQQPVRGVKSPGAATVTIGGGGQLTAPQVTGAVNRVRFEADRLELLPDGTRVATNIRITNDPFSPPELEYRARRATIRRISPTAEELVTTQPRLVFDNRLKIPVYPRRQVFDSQQRSGPCLSFGYDGGDRGGLFAECPFEVIPTGPVRLTLTPQFYIQRTIEENGGNPFSPDNFGLKARLRATLGPQTRLDGSAIFLNFDNFPNLAERDFRGNLRLRQAVGTHTLAAEYSYRDRLFNGSLGFQTVHSSLGAVLTSPVIPLGRSGINLSYQTGYQFINADTDRPDLLDPIRENNR